MRFFRKPARAAIITILSLTLVLPACHRKISTEEKNLRRNLNHALAVGSYREAELLARRVLQYAPDDNGIWDCLIQAQCAQADYKGAKETFTAWRSSVRKPSPKLDEYIDEDERPHVHKKKIMRTFGSDGGPMFKLKAISGNIRINGY